MKNKKWTILQWGENGRSKDKAIENAASIFKNILKSGLKKKLNLGDQKFFK